MSALNHEELLHYPTHANHGSVGALPLASQRKDATSAIILSLRLRRLIRLDEDDDLPASGKLNIRTEYSAILLDKWPSRKPYRPDNSTCLASMKIQSIDFETSSLEVAVQIESSGV